MTDSESLVLSVKEAALKAINELVSHNVKGSDLLQKGFQQMTDIVTEVADWYEILKNILITLKPFFELVGEWIKEAYTHLLEVWEWAKDMWQKIFGGSN